MIQPISTHPMNLLPSGLATCEHTFLDQLRVQSILHEYLAL